MTTRRAKEYFSMLSLTVTNNVTSSLSLHYTLLPNGYSGVEEVDQRVFTYSQDTTFQTWLDHLQQSIPSTHDYQVCILSSDRLEGLVETPLWGESSL